MKIYTRKGDGMTGLWYRGRVQKASAGLDVARAAIRRAERRVSALNAAGELADDTVLRYLNRFADAVFALARFADRPDPELFQGRDAG